jgi:anti-sigma regulatory factor (Ser/Thr protein kinase)
MTRIRTRGEEVRRYILEHVENHPTDINRLTAVHFGTTRQAVNKHLRRLVGEGALDETGNTRNREYKLCSLSEWRKLYYISADLAEDVIWRTDIAPVLGQMSDNVKDIWHYGFTEMFNNAIDHSEGKTIFVWIAKTAATTEMTVMDDGVGIFKKIQSAMNLLDERHAVLELAKGKLTTDPANHTGEGIFFSSRMFDKFSILAGGVHFTHKFGDDLDWILERASDTDYHTFVGMSLSNHTSRTVRKVFDQYTAGDDYGFNKTVVPVELAQYGDDKLISRSQAKRLLARIELFKIVMLDFAHVPAVGQAFADEIFRVFAQRHPEIELIPVHTSSEVRRMIDRAKSGLT